MKNNNELFVKNCVRSALVGIGTVGITHIPRFRETFGDNSANMELFLGGVAALLLYDRSPRKPIQGPKNSMTGDVSLSDISVKTMSELFQLAAVCTSFWYNTKTACGVFTAGCISLVACRYSNDNKEWGSIRKACGLMIQHLSCHKLTPIFGNDETVPRSDKF